MTDVVLVDIRRSGQRDLGAVRESAGRGTVRSGEAPEEIVEGAVLLDDEDDLLDRHPGRDQPLV